MSPSKNVTDKLFALRQNYKDINNDVMHFLVKLLLKSLYGEQFRKDFEEKFACKSVYWMRSEHDERVKEF